MLRFTKPVLLSFSGSLASKSISLNNEPCIERPNLINLKPIELNYYPIIIVLERCNGSCNTLDDSFDVICVPKSRRCKF